jgi:hypothetical protein
MTHLKQLAAATAAAAILAVPAAAGAATPEQRTVQQAFPLATRICSELAKGGGPERVRPLAAEVLVACAKLESGFATAQTTFQTAYAPVGAAIASIDATVHAACLRPLERSSACGHAIASTRAMWHSLMEQRRMLLRARAAAVEASRAAFWATFRAIEIKVAAMRIPDTHPHH